MPAPIDLVAVADVLAPFGESRTLPAEAYTSRELFDWERKYLFGSGWTCVGRAADLVRPGQVRAVESPAGNLIVTADTQGSLAVFHNVCRHRGHELVPAGDAIDARLIRCPYHSWSYRLDGRLKAAPLFAGTPGFALDAWPLVKLRRATWRGWLFVDPSGTAPAMDDHIGNLDELVEPYRPERLVRGGTHIYEARANWKLIVENYHECYHCTSIHPELCRVSPPDEGSYLQPTGLWAGGSMILMDHAETMSLDGRSGAPRLPGVGDELARKVLYAAVWPNLLISAHPDYVMTHTLIPIQPNSTRIVCEWYFDPSTAEDPAFSPAFATDFWDITNREDFAACENVQRGTESGGYRPGPLHMSEATVYQFLTMVATGYLDQPIPVPTVPPAVHNLDAYGTNPGF
jgi:Rieske 2Fe-2S family protein